MTLTGRRSLLMIQESAILQIPTMREYLTSLYLKQRIQRGIKRGRNEHLDLCQVNALCNTRHRAPGSDNAIYYIPITDTTLELFVFWPSDTESRIDELRFSESISLSFKTRLTSVTCFCGEVNCEHGTSDGKHVDITSRNVTLWQTFPQFFGIKDLIRF